MPLAIPESLRLLLPDGKIKTILLEDYLRGVIAAALPADAPLEAQKALAVAARTFAANTHRHSERNADVCTLRHCQAWNERANPRAARAVLETRSIVATFDDKLIEAFYFDHCDGKTRDSKGVLMDAPRYLKGVACPCGFASMKGHGIGMCQRGMLAMARLGEAYINILTHYYSGITLQQIGVEANTKIPFTRSTSTSPRQSSPKPRTTAKPAPGTTSPLSRTELRLADTATDKPATPRRSPRQKPEQQPSAPAQESTPSLPQASTPPAEPTAAASPPSEAYVTLNDVHSPEENDLFLFLTVDDVKPAAPPPIAAPLYGVHPPPAFDTTPPPTMPEEEFGAFEPQMFAPPTTPPPPTMPEEDLPTESELDFLAPPIGAMPEEPALADFVAPAANFIEPDLMDFMPPVERFYTPLDAPPTMPEPMPSFTNSGADETPIAWAPPPPMQESAWAMNQPRVLMDVLPGPRIIAGNLATPGTLITIRDARGNSIVTVSGVARQYGQGGFEAPLTDDGAYQVKFNGTELDVSLQDETVFIYYQ